MRRYRDPCALGFPDPSAGPGTRPTLTPIPQAALMAIDPRWAVPVRIMIYGDAIGIMLVSTLRMLFPPCDTRPRSAT